MFREEKHLKDSVTDLGITVKDSPLPIAYTKTNKLITALYMVTDIIDKDEPLRGKLRTLGAGIISDISSAPFNVCHKISEVMSFLDIASAVNIISPMNANILRKEFVELDQAIKEAANNIGNKIGTLNRHINLSEYFKQEDETPVLEQPNHSHNQNSIGHARSNSVGVQKGSTLLKALSKVTVSDKKIVTKPTQAHVHNFDILKKQRREEIINFIKKNGGNATITDIKNGAHGSLVSTSEKTLQRELISMIKDSVLNKTGEKRWSKYFLKS